jgi:ribosome-associated protein
MIQITPDIEINENDIIYEFVRSSGPGGQHVNKVATAVQLRFDAKRAGTIPPAVYTRLKALAGKRMTEDGVIIIQAQRFRSQERNRQDALERLVKLVRKAAEKPKSRKKTRPTRASIERTIAAKRHRGRLKQTRQRVSKNEE